MGGEDRIREETFAPLPQLPGYATAWARPQVFCIEQCSSQILTPHFFQPSDASEYGTKKL